MSIIGNPITLGGGKAPAPAGRSDVNFYDYDGSIVASYTAADFANLSAMPENPTHEGLTAQGWNYTLADAKAYVASYGKLDVGQMYVTDDGKTRIYIKLEDGRLAPYLGLAVNGTATIEWGDGTSDTVTGSDLTTVISTQHTYTSAGEYVIAISVIGEIGLIGESSVHSKILWSNSTTYNANLVYQEAIKHIELGNNCSILAYAFSNCYSLKTITIPNQITSIGNYAFDTCVSIKHISCPLTLSTIDNSAFSNCYNLRSIALNSGLTSIGIYGFQQCNSLETVTIPNGISILRNYIFSSCAKLEKITIPISVTSIYQYAFRYCYNLNYIKLSNNMTAIGISAFQECFGLKSIEIPSNVTVIGNNAFSSCAGLHELTIPNNVTEFGRAAFSGCNGLAKLTFTRATPPTAGASAFTIAVDCIIYVPRGSLSAYTGAANYPSSSTYTYVEYDP